MPSERKSSRGIVLDGDEVVLIRRVKKGTEYWVTPGGGLEDGEQPEQALDRELDEELNIKVSGARLVLEVRSIVSGVLQHDFYFLAQLVSGAVDTIKGPEAERASGDNVYEPRKVTLQQLAEIELVPQYVKELIQKILRGEQVEMMTLNLVPDEQGSNTFTKQKTTSGDMINCIVVKRNLVIRGKHVEKERRLKPNLNQNSLQI